MGVETFVLQRLGKFRQRGKELQLYYCPFCHGGEDKQKFTFSINVETGAYNCLRLNNCGVRGSFKQLQDKFGEASDVRVIEKKAYRPPTKHKILPLVDAVKDYLILERGISEETLEIFKIGSDGRNSVVFPFYENGKLAMTKFRGIKDKAFYSDGYKPILFGIDVCNNADTVVITEGEIDCLSVYQSLKNEDVSGVDVVGMPNGANNLEFINLNWDFLKGKKIILFGDNDKAGIECMQNISDRLGNCSWILSEHGKDANEIMLKVGMEQVVQEILNASAIEDEEICLAVNIESKNIADVKTVPFGFYGIDSKIGGSRMGEITVWTGYPGSGKTTILNQLILNTIDAGEYVGLYSGEFAPQIITSWIDQQAAGAEFLTRRTNKTTGMDFYIVDSIALGKIRAWYGNKLVLYAPRRGVNVYDDILEKFQHIYNRYGCRIFVVDNLLKVMTKVDSRDYNTKQAEFIDACTQFAHDNAVHIHIIAHPRKSVTGKGEELELDDVAGTSNIGNLADNVLAVKRITDKDRKTDWYEQIQRHADMQDFNAVIKVMKNRFGGVVGGMVPMIFDVASKRTLNCCIRNKGSTDGIRRNRYHLILTTREVKQMGSSSFDGKQEGMHKDFELLLEQGVLIGLVDDKVKISKMRGGEISKEAADAFTRIKAHKLAFVHFLKEYKKTQMAACEDLILDAYGDKLFEDGEVDIEWEGEHFFLQDGQIQQAAEWFYQQILK